MNEAAILISLASLAVAAVAYWRVGGKRDVEVARRKVEQELEVLRAKQQELGDALMIAIEEAYQSSSHTLAQTAEGLRRLKEEAIEGLEQQIEHTAQHLHGLERRLEEGLKSARESTLETAQRIQWEVRRRVHRLDARGSLLYAKAAAVSAIR
jgi:hypothetical protein